MTLSPQLLKELVAMIATELAPRVAAELAGQLPTAEPTGAEPWRLLDLGETAARLGRSARWVRERAKRRDLPHVRLDGGALAFDLDDAQAFARARRVPDAGALPLASRLQAVAAPASTAESRQPHRAHDRRVR